MIRRNRVIPVGTGWFLYPDDASHERTVMRDAMIECWGRPTFKGTAIHLLVIDEALEMRHLPLLTTDEWDERQYMVEDAYGVRQGLQQMIDSYLDVMPKWLDEREMIEIYMNRIAACRELLRWLGVSNVQ